ncbi:poly(U)-specific endoribonuclease-like [Chanos chanos]|uniref:Uridylate-specific endoribonuclease n=1 Tax=Chanos chanos TaxID=29144 RepID=A0A6J2VRS7_CHACN|nr:poly(U)-specific endoribonuclease-like [Chanos chanos]
MMKITLLLTLTLLAQGYSNTLDSCAGRCGYGVDSSYTCQCNTACERYGDCCTDYFSLCKAQDSCKGRCGYGTDWNYNCQCNSACERYGDCCADYTTYCTEGSGTTISDADIKALSEKLYSLDYNKATAFEVTISPQRLISSSQTSGQIDYSSSPLFQYVDEATLFSKPTYKALINLLDNYQRTTGVTESFSSQQLSEQDTFLREAISYTTVGKELYAFLNSKGVYSTETDFIYDLKMMWFGLYSRYNGKMDSSGFEHIFAGEIKGGKVSGFHNWVQFYLLEKRGLLNYYSHSFNGPWTSYPDVLGMQFNWDGYYKSVGSAIIGASPEFDLAMYSLCYITRPGKRCQLSIGGQPLVIQTYTWNNSSYGDGKKYIGSAYPATP